jgi:hypothetical protein
LIAINRFFFLEIGENVEKHLIDLTGTERNLSRLSIQLGADGQRRSTPSRMKLRQATGLFAIRILTMLR